jgi:cation:H+ antiporter
MAVGTSLPELATSLIAAFHSQSEIAISSIVVSTIFNVSGNLGVTAVIVKIPVKGQFPTF